MGVDGFSGRSALNRLSQNKKATLPALVGVLANKKRRSEVPDESPNLSRHPVRGVVGGDADNGKKKSHPFEVASLWELTDSNRRPSACKADALNQLS